MTNHLYWRKSSYSGGQADCVELAARPAALLVRDSKHPTAPHLTLTRRTFTLLAAHIRTVRAS